VRDSEGESNVKCLDGLDDAFLDSLDTDKIPANAPRFIGTFDGICITGAPTVASRR
jgi:hypothetical protein